MPPTETPGQEPAAEDHDSPVKRLAGRIESEHISALGLPVALLLLIVFFSFQTDTFLTFSNSQNIVRQASVTAIAAVGITVLFVGGGIDISQGGVIALSGLTAIHLINVGLPTLSVIAIVLALGLVLGGLNGFFAEFLGIPALIATLGTNLVFRGLGFVATDGRSVAIDRFQDDAAGQALLWIGRGSLGPVPTPFVVALVATIVAGVAMRRTVWGRHTYAIGGNQAAAEAVGINVRRHRWKIYALAGMMSTLAGLVVAGRLGSATPSAAPTAEFDVITAAVLGGVSIYGGQGRVGRVLLAAIFLAALANGLVQMNVSTFWERVIRGLVFLGALSLDRIRLMGRPT